MFAVRYAALAALVVWLGGMLVLVLVVAPSTFHVLQSAEPSGGAALAGALVGDILHSFHWLAYACGGVILVALVLMKLVGPPPAAFPVRAAIAAIMLAVALYSGEVVAGEVARLEAGAPPVATGPADPDPRRARVDLLHRRARTLLTLNVVLGLVSLFWYARE